MSGSGSEQPRMRAFEGYLRKKFDEEAAISLSDVHSVESFWKYHNESFMPATRKQYEIQKTIKHTHTHAHTHTHLDTTTLPLGIVVSTISNSHVIFQKPIYLCTAPHLVPDVYQDCLSTELQLLVVTAFGFHLAPMILEF